MPAAAEVIHQRMPARKQVGSFFSCSRPQRSISATLTQAVTMPLSQRSAVTDCKNSSGQAVRT